MAKRRKRNPQDTSSVDTSLFNKGMVKDMNASFQGKATWSHARNAYNNSVEGDLAVIGNEPSNFSCAEIPYTIIGVIHLYSDKWVIFSTDDISSEIGLFDDSECTYETVVNDLCLNFNKMNLIKGASKENFDCTWQIYWDDDARNPSRTLNLNDIPWIQQVTSPVGEPCVIYEDTTDLDCEKIRLAPLLDTPCVTLEKAESGGQLRNGSYQVYIAYTVNDQKIGDYIGISNVQSLFAHEDTTGALLIEVSNLDKEFEFYELVILSNTQSQIQAKRIGYYSTEQSRIHIGYIDQSLPVVPVELLPLRNPAYEKSDSMYVVNDWLIRSGPTEQFDFNYQILANKIKTKWVSVAYPAKYYYNGGNKPTFMRDEVYSFFIRFIYNTGERSSSYHIPGRSTQSNELDPAGTDGIGDIDDKKFEYLDYAISEGLGNFPFDVELDDGGEVVDEGSMGYWESSEKYPASQPEIWGNLCGESIRHHKMPVETTDVGGTTELSGGTNNDKINIIAVRFLDISPPVYNDGVIIPNIVGYEILRGSREGNKSILAKGIFRNMRTYVLTESGGSDVGTTTGYYPNFPYNDLNPDVYHTSGIFPVTTGCDNYDDSITKSPPLGNASRDTFTFHSPELMFKKPYLNAYYTRLYGSLTGRSVGQFVKSEDHPQNKLLRNGSLLIAGVFGVGYALEKIRGASDTKYVGTKNLKLGLAENPLSLPFAASYTGTIAPPALALGAVPVPIPSSLSSPSIYANPASGPGGLAIADMFSMEAVDLVFQDVILEIIDNAFGDAGDILTGAALFDFFERTIQSTENVAKQAPLNSYIGGGTDMTRYGSAYKEVPTLFKLLTGTAAFIYFTTEGAQKIVDVIYELISAQDFAWKYNSHGFYNEFSKFSQVTSLSSKIEEQSFINNTLTSFAGGKVNNLQRPQTVGIKQAKDQPSNFDDNSRYVIGTVGDWDDPGKIRNRDIRANYGALKFSFKNQYGQLDGIKQIPVRSCVHIIDKELFEPPYSSTSVIDSPVMFGGDCYINRYTEKVIMPLFWDFLKGQPDGYPYNYLLRQNIPHPRYWMNTERYSTTQFIQSIVSNLGGLTPFAETALPTSLFYMDRPNGDCGGGWNLGVNGNLPNLFQLTKGYMYTHCNGVQDFFVESEINLAQRDWEEAEGKKHYDWIEYGGLSSADEMFHANTIKKGNFYKYDYSLSISRFPSTLASWGNLQPRDYDPEVAETCFSYYPKRLIYSLQAQKEAKKDFWRVFLPNNYKDFKSQVNVIKPVNKSGALIMFPYLSPQMFQGLDTLKTDLGTKLTIGDGGLFSQPFQNVVNSDISNEYGSCESERSVINTPAGLFYLSQEQGKVFQYAGQGLENIANRGMKWWFNKYLPSQLLKQFPELEGGLLSDNPVVGVGCQSIYDPNDDIVYFCKRDYVCNEDSIINIPGPRPSPGDPPARLSGPPVGKKVCDCIEYNQELGFVFNLTLCGDAVPTNQCPEGYIYNESTKQCEKETCVPCNSFPGFKAGCWCPEGYTHVQDPLRCCKTEIIDALPVDKYLPIDLDDEFYFKDVSWTVSYDPKAKAWISFHDWHPELSLPSINHFLTTKTQTIDEVEHGGIWKHNQRCDSFVNYYGVDYPWEIELVETTGQAVNTIRSLEYQLESYIYKGNDLNSFECGDDRWHDLDWNFDEAIIYNTEQVSGLLKLNLSPKGDPVTALQYPVVGTNDIQILYTKEEQKYRFNQFWDVTKDRGEFSNVQQQIWITQLNGYIKEVSNST